MLTIFHVVTVRELITPDPGAVDSAVVTYFRETISFPHFRDFQKYTWRNPKFNLAVMKNRDPLLS